MECLACEPTVSDVGSAGDVGALEEKLKVRAPSEDNLSIVALRGTFCVDGSRLRALHVIRVVLMQVDNTITVNRSQLWGHRCLLCHLAWCGAMYCVVRCTVWYDAACSPVLYSTLLYSGIAWHVLSGVVWASACWAGVRSRRTIRVLVASSQG